MAATTISSYSDALTSQRSGSQLASNLQGGKVRVAAFTLTLASQASGTSFAVAIIPAGARISGGSLYADGTLANSATLAVGLAGKDGTGNVDSGTGTIPSYAGGTTTGPLSDSTTCLKAAAAQGATKVDFALTSALGYGYVTTKELYLTLTTGTGTVATEVVKGEIRYTVE